MDISIIIPSFNSQDTIGETLKSIQSQVKNCEAETIIVDCSAHEQVKNIASGFIDLQYIHEDQRFNPGKGRNIGSQHATGRLLIFIDADILLAEDAIQHAWNRYQEGYKVFGGALELNRATSIGLSSWLEHFFFNHEAQKNRPVCERSNLSSALMCFDRELFLTKGGFRDIPRMQDTELTERLRKKGLKLYFFPDILAYQTQDSSLSKVLRKIYINGQNLYNIRYKPHMTPTKKIMLFVLLPLIGLGKILRIIYRHLKYQPWSKKFTTLMLVIPLLFAILYWVCGFYNALIFEKGVSSHR